MGDPARHGRAVFIVAVSSRHDAAFAWARERAQAEYGPIARSSPRFDFRETDYYDQTMGPGLYKEFWTFVRPFDPEDLPLVKLTTNAWESAYARLKRHAEERPLNLDPGYLTQAKLVLASTKDHAHRIYLSRGIFAEVTLFYKHRQWQPREWTFPDYRRDDYRDFFDAVRDDLKTRRPAGERPRRDAEERA